MTELPMQSDERTSDQLPQEGHSEDVIAASAIVVIAVLGAIHFAYTGGLLAFLGDIF